MRAFTAVCAGQTVSLLGTGMTGFALTIWAYLQTGSATTLALAAFFRFAPTVVLSPIAGALVGLAGYGVRVVREAETLLPDHDAEPGVASPSGAKSAGGPAAAAGTGVKASHAAKGEDPPPP